MSSRRCAVGTLHPMFRGMFDSRGSSPTQLSSVNSDLTNVSVQDGLALCRAACLSLSCSLLLVLLPVTAQYMRAPKLDRAAMSAKREWEMLMMMAISARAAASHTERVSAAGPAADASMIDTGMACLQAISQLELTDSLK